MISIRLKQLRSEHNLTQTDLAKILGIAKTTLAAYEQEKSEPSIETLVKIADYFNVTTDYLIGRSDGKTTDLQKLYEKIGLSEDSIALLEFMAKGEKEHSNPVLLKVNPIKSIDFCLSQGQLSFDLFDCIHAYFIANVPDDKQLYVSDTGEVLLSPTFSGKDTLYQTIPASYLRDAILQEISNNLKKLKEIYDQENSI
jgi:transcriptional regulator with XRE-family HTH domain